MDVHDPGRTGGRWRSMNERALCSEEHRTRNDSSDNGCVAGPAVDIWEAECPTGGIVHGSFEGVTFIVTVRSMNCFGDVNDFRPSCDQREKKPIRTPSFRGNEPDLADCDLAAE